MIDQKLLRLKQKAEAVGEKRLIFLNHQPENQHAQSAETREKINQELVNLSKARSKVSSDSAEKLQTDAAKIDSVITENVDAILKTGYVPGIKPPLGVDQLPLAAISSLIYAAEESPKAKENMAKILEFVKSGKINAGQLDLHPKKALIDHFQNDKKALDAIIKATFVSTISANHIIRIIENRPTAIQALRDNVKNNPESQKVFQTVYENLALLVRHNNGISEYYPFMTPDQKAFSLFIETSEHDKKILYRDVLKENLDKFSWQSLENIAKYTFFKLAKSERKHNDQEAKISKFLPLNLCKDLLNDYAKDKKNQKFYQALLANISTENKAEILKDDSTESVNTKIQKDLSSSKITEAPSAKSADKKAPETVKATNEFVNKSATEKIKAAGLDNLKITKKKIIFHVGGSRRSFLKRESFLTELSKKQYDSPEKTKLAVYQKLLDIITKDGSIKSNKWKVKNFNKSNSELKNEIRRLESTISGKPLTKAEKSAETTTAKTKKAETATKKSAEKARKTTTWKPGEKITRQSSSERQKKYPIPKNNKELQAKFGDLFPESESKITNRGLEFEVDANPGVPKLYLALENDELVIKYNRPYVEDLAKIHLGSSVSDKELKQAVYHQASEAREDFNDYTQFAELDSFKDKINDLHRQFNITDPKIKELANNDTEWIKNFDRLENSVIYLDALRSQFNISDRNQAAAKMLEIIQIGFNDRLDFSDILKVTKSYESTEKFETRFLYLQRNKAENPKELRRMYEMYIGAMKILKSIEKDKYREPKYATSAEIYQYQIERAETTDEKAINNRHFNLDDLLAGKSPRVNEGKTLLGLSRKTETAFGDVYANAFKEPVKNWPQELILQTLLKAYRFDELISLHNVIKVNKETGKLVLTGLPENFTDEKDEVRAVLRTLNGHTLTNENQERVRAGLSSSSEAFEARILKKLKKAEAKAKSDVFTWGFISSAVSIDTRMTRTDIRKHYDAGEVRRYTSPEAMAKNLLESPKVVIKNNKGQKETITIYRFEKGVKVINQENLKRYVNHLMLEGLKRQDIFNKQKERVYDFDDMTSDDFELTESDALNLFVKAPKDEIISSWAKIPGRQGIEDALAKAPFNIKKSQVPETVHNLLTKTFEAEGDDHIDINMKGIFKALLNEKLKQGYNNPKNPDVNQVTNLETLKEEYTYLIDRGNELLKNPRQNKKEIAEIKKRYFQLKSYVDAAAILIQRLEKISKPYQSPEDLYKKIALPEGPDSAGFLKFNLRPEQVSALNTGYVVELQRDKISQSTEVAQRLSKLPQIAKIQKEAIKAGYPINEIGEVENKINAAGFLSLRGKEISGGGAGFAIPLGHGIKVAFGIKASKNPSLNTGISMQIYNTEERSGNVGLGATISSSPKISLGYMHSEKLNTNLDLLLAVGAIMTASGPKAMAGLGISYNENRATKEALKSIIRSQGLEKIEAATNTKEKAKLLRKNPYFKDFQSKLDDVDLIAIYESWKTENQLKAFKEGAPAIPITAIGIGIAFPPAVGMLGIKIRIGSSTLIKPHTGERERLAGLSSTLKIKDQLKTLYAQNSSDGIEFIDQKDDRFYMKADGTFGLLQEGSKEKISGPMTNYERLRQQIKKTDTLDIRKTPVKGGVELLELSVLDYKDRDIDIYVDDHNEDLKIALDKKTGKIFIAGTTKELVITKETFRYTHEKRKDGAVFSDVIIISTNPNFDRNTVIRESKQRLSKRWENGKTTSWEITKGINTGGYTQIRDMETYDEDELRGDQYRETLFGTDVELIKAGDKIAGKIRSSLSPLSAKAINEQHSRFEEKGQKVAKDIYKQMAKSLRKGAPAIHDRAGIIKAANDILENTQPKGPKPLNIKEANQLFTFIQHQYFVNIWKKRGVKGIEKAFDRNNEVIRTSVLKPTFEKAIKTLGLKPVAPATTAAEYAEKLSQIVSTETAKEFKTRLATFKESKSKNIEKFFADSFSEIGNEKLFYTGTTIRETHKGLLSGGIRTAEMPNIAKMGIIGKPTTWETKGQKQEYSDIAKILLEATNPAPKLENIETLKSPTAMKLAVFGKAMVMEIGRENYEVLGEFLSSFYKAPESQNAQFARQIQENPKLKQAITAFIAFNEKVRKAITSGKEKSEVKLQNGMTMIVKAPEIQTGSYGKCGNLSIMTQEAGFAILHKDRSNIVIASTKTYVHSNTRLSKEVYDFAIGVSYQAKQRKLDGKDHTDGPAEEITEDGKKPGGLAEVDTKDGTKTVETGPASLESH